MGVFEGVWKNKWFHIVTIVLILITLVAYPFRVLAAIKK